jgi:para-aminobenzoate synthetase component 1
VLARAAQQETQWEGQWHGGPAELLVGRDRYLAAIDRIHRYLRAGDCYQVNYAQPLEAPFSGDPLALYQQMRKRNPSPYGAFLAFPFVTVLSASPEGFLHLQGDRIVTRPIKGTRPRGENREQDGRLARELAASPKDRAENLMIVDLLRNDLGKVCRPGSIQVPELFAVESFPLVHHLVSTVQGRLAPGEDALSLLAACFPGGSITGAPKRRAMEIIRELEQRPRGVYCGSIGWIGYDGDMETNIAIRTLQLQRGRARYWAGGGIVIDSDAQEEYAETLHKAAAFLQVFDGAVQGTAGGRLSHVPPQEGMR